MSLSEFLRRAAGGRTSGAAFVFAGCPFPPIAATGGILLTGSPGSGKSVLKNQTTDPILWAIASREPGSPWRRAIIYAHKAREVLRRVTGLGIPRNEIAVLHPGRLDCAPLDESADYRGEDGIHDFVNALFPHTTSNEPFWMDACQLVSGGVPNVFARQAVGPWYSDDCLYAYSDTRRFNWILNQWEGNRALVESFFGPEAGRMRESVLFTLETHAKKLRVSAKQLRAARARGNRPFSFVRDWMLGDGPRIVVVCDAPTYSKSWGTTFVPFIIETAIRAFKEHTRHSPLNTELTLFDFDEFVQFKLSEPVHFFAVARELGGVPLVAVQSIPLLDSVYGKDLARGIASNLSFQAHGASNDDETAELASASFGEHELERVPRERKREPDVIREPRVPKDAFLQVNNARSLRFFCRAPGVGAWRYDIQRRDIIRNSPRTTEADLEEERMLVAPSADFEPWGEDDLRRLGLHLPTNDERWPDFLDPNRDWRSA